MWVASAIPRVITYPVRAEDLLDAATKLGASREEIIAMLDRAGFFAQASGIEWLQVGTSRREDGKTMRIPHLSA